MKAFRFRLQSILDLRRRELDEALRIFGAATQTRETLEARMTRLMQIRQDAFDAVKAHRRLAFTPVNEFQGRANMAAAEEAVRDMHRQVDAARKDELTKRQEYLQAKVRLDAFEKLRAKAQDDFRRGIVRQAEAELEDVVNARWSCAV